MTDLIARLREHAQKVRADADAAGFTTSFVKSNTLAIEAADEIERLRAALSEIADGHVFPDDKINRVSLHAAIGVAQRALEQKVGDK